MRRLKSWYKAILNRLEVRRAMATQTKILGPADEQTTRFFEKCTDLKQPYLSSTNGA